MTWGSYVHCQDLGKERNCQLKKYNKLCIVPSLVMLAQRADGADSRQERPAAFCNLIFMNGSTDYVELYAYEVNAVSPIAVSGSTNTYFNGFLARAA